MPGRHLSIALKSVEKIAKEFEIDIPEAITMKVHAIHLLNHDEVKMVRFKRSRRSYVPDPYCEPLIHLKARSVNVFSVPFYPRELSFPLLNKVSIWDPSPVDIDLLGEGSYRSSPWMFRVPVDVPVALIRP